MAQGKILSVASEAVPLVKTGGLADVVGALPAALAPLGWDMRVMLPAYSALRPLLDGFTPLTQELNLFGGPAQIYGGAHEGLQLYLLDAPHLFDRAGGPYNDSYGDYGDNPFRFAALSWMAAKLGAEGAGGWQPDILHLHDWQAGFAPYYLRKMGGTAPVKSMITIHNIAFQGWADARHLADLRLEPEDFHAGALEYYGGLSSLKAGLIYADHITTVSPRYAEELMRPEFGLGLEGVVAARARDVSGILNGVDETLWSPEIEPIAFSSTKMAGKAKARAALCAEFGLDVAGPLAIVVSRLTDQKGIDLIPQVADDFVAQGGGMVILGSGAPDMEAAMRAMANRHPTRIGLHIGYSEALSHRLFAGGDAILVPSRFEPCGLTQLYGLRYGTLPVVAATGGLADTVINASPASIAAKSATGISFHPTDALGLRQALARLVQLYADRPLWAQMQRNAMRQPVGWGPSAAAYGRLYDQLLARPSA